MPMNEEVRKAVERIDDSETITATPHPDCNALVKIIDVDDWWAIRAELTRLTEIADAVDPLVIRLGEVTTRLEAANALLREAIEWNWLDEGAPRPDVMDVLDQKIQSHLSEPRT